MLMLHTYIHDMPKSTNFDTLDIVINIIPILCKYIGSTNMFTAEF